MITTVKNVSYSIIAASLMAGPASAGGYMTQDVIDEVRSCVAETNSRISTEGATRVQHLIRDYQSSAIGYAIKIESSVFTPESETNYSVYCVANGSHTPIKFRIRELQS